MNALAKWLFMAIGLVLIALGLTAIITEVNTVSTRKSGLVTLVGDDAAWMGYTLLLLSILPLSVLLPNRWLSKLLSVWYVTVIGWIFLYIAK